jgi:hypothetical protein
MPPAERRTHAAHMGRLRKLEQLSLAHERQTGVWEIEADMEARLKALGHRGDIIQTMHRSLRAAGIDRPAGSFAIFDSQKLGNRVVGRVAAIGLTDEINDRNYLVLDGIDGKVHYVDAGRIPSEIVPEKGMIASIEAPAQGSNNSSGIRLRILSYLSLEKLIEADGATWLDRELLSKTPETLVDRNFGAEGRRAMTLRRQWLVSQSLGSLGTDGKFRPAPNMLGELRQRNMHHAGLSLSKQLGLTHTELLDGERVSGTYLRTVHLASGKYALIQKAQEFALVPWQPQLERRKGQELTGVIKANGDWSLHRSRGRGVGAT